MPLMKASKSKTKSLSLATMLEYNALLSQMTINKEIKRDSIAFFVAPFNIELKIITLPLIDEPRYTLPSYKIEIQRVESYEWNYGQPLKQSIEPELDEFLDSLQESDREFVLFNLDLFQRVFNFS